MKLVMLDIDGVLNSSRSVVAKLGPTVASSERVRELARLDEHDRDPSANFEEWLEYGVRHSLQTVDPVAVALVNRLLVQPDVGLVLISSHRKYLLNPSISFRSANHRARLRLYLTAMGLQVPEFFSLTPELHRPRGEEVDQWLNHAWEEGIFDEDDGDRYVILDDSADFLPDQPHVRPDATLGLSFADYAIACRLLGVDEPSPILV